MILIPSISYPVFPNVNLPDAEWKLQMQSLMLRQHSEITQAFSQLQATPPYVKTS